MLDQQEKKAQNQPAQPELEGASMQFQGLDSGMASTMPPNSNVAGLQAAANNSPQVKQLKTLQQGVTSGVMQQKQDQAPIQRQIVPFQSDASVVGLAAIQAADATAQMIDRLVQEARAVALNWRVFQNEDDSGYLKLWYNTAKKFTEETEDVSDFIHARFGYAIETIACKQLGSEINGLVVDLQVASGMTRPDIVLSTKTGQQVAWIDITASNSTGHIKDKASKGWSSKPYVCEITYPSLDLKEIFTGSDDPIYKKIGEFQVEKSSNRKQAFGMIETDMRTAFDSILGMDGMGGPGGNQQKKKQTTATEVKKAFGQDFGGNNIHQSINSAVHRLGYVPSSFGYKDEKQSSKEVEKYIRKEAQPHLDNMNQNLLKDKMDEQVSFLSDYSFKPEVQEFQQLSSDKMDEETLFAGIALSTAEEFQNKLFTSVLKLTPHAKSNHGIAQMINKIQMHIFHRKSVLDFNHLQAWTKEAQALQEWCVAMLEEVDTSTGSGGSGVPVDKMQE